VGIYSLEPNLNLALFWRELHRVGKQIPDHLLQALGVASDQTDARIDNVPADRLISLRPLLDGIDGGLHDLRQICGLHIQSHAAALNA
jgi:hypothetical protein